MAVQASVALSAARTLLNDDGASLWTDAVLMPKLAIAHRELQVILRKHSASIMRIEATSTVNIAATSLLVPPTDIIEPIKLWEKGVSEGNELYTLMTEYDPLPLLATTTKLLFWQWTDNAIKFLGSTVARTVKVLYWRSLLIPSVNTDSLTFTDAELYLGPRTAALAAGSVGDKEQMGWATDLAKEKLEEVILSNRGRLVPAGGSTARP